MCDPMTVIAGVTSLAGLMTTGYGAEAQTQAASDMNTAQKAMYGLQKQQMELNAWQQQRGALRQAAIAQGSALNAAANQTGSVSGSGIQGGLSAISANTDVNYGNISRGLQIGEQYANQEINYANANMAYQQAGAIVGMGGMLASSSQSIGRLGAYGYTSLFGSSNSQPMSY